ncbi:unnamed protein product [Ectocarpus sp. 12 AP-2014]
MTYGRSLKLTDVIRWKRKVYIDLRERRRRFGKVDGEDDKCINICDCGSECENRVHAVTECRLYKKQREVYVTELGKGQGNTQGSIEAWKSQEKTVAVLGHRKWVEKAGSDFSRIDRLGKTFLSQLWQSRKERIGRW